MYFPTLTDAEQTTNLLIIKMTVGHFNEEGSLDAKECKVWLGLRKKRKK